MTDTIAPSGPALASIPPSAGPSSLPGSIPSAHLPARPQGFNSAPRGRAQPPPAQRPAKRTPQPGDGDYLLQNGSVQGQGSSHSNGNNHIHQNGQTHNLSFQPPRFNEGRGGGPAGGRGRGGRGGNAGHPARGIPPHQAQTAADRYPEYQQRQPYIPNGDQYHAAGNGFNRPPPQLFEGGNGTGTASMNGISQQQNRPQSQHQHQPKQNSNAMSANQQNGGPSGTNAHAHGSDSHIPRLPRSQAQAQASGQSNGGSGVHNQTHSHPHNQPRRPVHSTRVDEQANKRFNDTTAAGIQTLSSQADNTAHSATTPLVSAPITVSAPSSVNGEQGGRGRGKANGRGKAKGKGANGSARTPDVSRARSPAPSAIQRNTPETSTKVNASATRSAVTAVPSVLTPSADAFVPASAQQSYPDAEDNANPSRSSGPKAKSTKKAKKTKQLADSGNGASAPAEIAHPPEPKSRRRAAFDEQTKLTSTISRSSTGSGGRAEEGHDHRAHGGGVQRRSGNKEPEKDDLVSRLTRGLGRKPFFECPICYNSILPSQPIWSCLPPDHPPAPPAQNLPPLDPKAVIAHYQACYTPFHMNCVKDWARRNLEEDMDRLRLIESDEEPGWRCPGCQKRRSDPVGGYKCFCGRLSHPQTSTTAPHSCNETCARKRNSCGHDCPLQCHPGPCPPCQVALIVPCPSHHTPLTVKCAAASSNNAALTPVCDEICSRELSCGNRDHECLAPCHYGPCAPCTQKETVTCYCGDDAKEVNCGWNRQDEKLCVKAKEGGKEERWAGRYSCGKACDRLFDCGIHPCKETCHPHPVSPLTCPFSPSIIVTCPCGTTPLEALPGFPRKDCLAPVPTCKSRCPKSRVCGHLCPRTCHEGPCPPCHEEVVRPCRCGESMLVIGCDELRERAERGEGELTCERVCRALRSCGRHECGRVCCPLAYQAKNRGKKRPNDDAVADDSLHVCHLTCGKLLSCGTHTCPKPDHKGACGRCLQASYDELVCHCGHTVVYPPVACGTTINCIYPCARPPPTCGHPKTPHTCHEQEVCPPCPYLTTKSCACGKDPAVKHIRCSQDRVSCGQICGELLGCGYHKCDKSCHRPGECDPCSQVCNKPKKICRHPCTSTCHAPAKCPETDPCQAIITQTCSCGNLQSRSSCGASTSNTTSRETVQLKCNSECGIKQRNARLADALGIKVAERGLTEWPAELKTFATANLGFVKMVEDTFKDFCAGQRQTLILPHMPPVKRTFVMSLADYYHLGRELIDQEPNRSVQIRRRVDTRLPNPLLSAAIPPPAPKLTLGGLGNLRAPTPTSTATSTSTSTPGVGGPSPAVVSAWGKPSNTTMSASMSATASAAVSAANTPNPSPPVSRTSSLQPLHGSRARSAQPQPQPNHNHTFTHGTGLGSNSLLSATMATQKPSRPATPVAPVLGGAGAGAGAGLGTVGDAFAAISVGGQERKGKVGQVDNDWDDESGDEA